MITWHKLCLLWHYRLHCTFNLNEFVYNTCLLMHTT